MLMSYAVTLSFFFLTAKIVQQQPVIKDTLPAPHSNLQCSLYSEKFMFPKSLTSKQENNLYLILQLHQNKVLTNSVAKLAP